MPTLTCSERRSRRHGPLGSPNIADQLGSSLVFAPGGRDIWKFVLTAYENDASILHFVEERLSAPVHLKLGEVARDFVAKCRGVTRVIKTRRHNEANAPAVLQKGQTGAQESKPKV